MVHLTLMPRSDCELSLLASKDSTEEKRTRLVLAAVGAIRKTAELTFRGCA